MGVSIGIGVGIVIHSNYVKYVWLVCAHPFGYTLSWAFFRSPKTQTALSARHLEQGLAPSHCVC